MFQKPKPKASPLDEQIQLLLLEMGQSDVYSDEYSTMITRLSLLYKLKEIEKPERVSKDTLALIAGNLSGIILILGFEKANIVTSKALGFVMKAR